MRVDRRVDPGLLDEPLVAQPDRRPLQVQGIGDVGLADRGVARQLVAQAAVRHRHLRHEPVQARHERALPARVAVVEGGRGEHQQVGQRARVVGQDVARRDQPAQRVSVEHERPVGMGGLQRGQSRLEVVVEVAPSLHVGASTRGGAEAALVVPVHVEPGRRQRRGDVRVAAGVLAQPVDDQRGRPGIARAPASGPSGGWCRRPSARSRSTVRTARSGPRSFAVPRARRSVAGAGRRR